MLQNNLLCQLCGIVGLIIVVLVFLATLIPQLEFDHDVEHAQIVRVILVLIILGLLRGAF